MAMTLEGPLADRDSWQATRCSVSKAMQLIGTRSAMLILREAFYGTRRFDQFAARVGITEAVAATRLKELVAAGVLVKGPYRETGQRTRHEYLLTTMGRDLLPVLLALQQWGDDHLQADGGPLDVVDARTGRPARVQVVNADGRPLKIEDLGVRASASSRRG